ncbi:hypothetical protein [Sulfobacillus thermosulfidooxidans]|uniref:hypothetical protein n=1 Tax=Sulfobacillus thermosulfidooxidans TaxID=28034 RepID=UPI000A5ED764|nr:hypothetical protein [Sulfobacillus thermosulfidooxidans]
MGAWCLCHHHLHCARAEYAQHLVGMGSGRIFWTRHFQASAGALFGHWMSRAHIPADLAKNVAQSTASATLLYGGLTFMLAGGLSLMFPRLQKMAWVTPIHIHKLHTLGDWLYSRSLYRARRWSGNPHTRHA